ncbi:MAG TPA: LuxR C-terminal-related transcriptional regulator [Gemmatimonadales bacterium]|jgi:DNA-binding CsgD family transcriptional regulator
MAAWWLEDYAAAIDARERAFRAFRAREDPLGAARVAVWLASDYADYRGELAIANGWLRRAERLLQGAGDVPERAWLGMMKGHFALMVDRDPAAARRLGAEASRIAREVGPADMEMVGVALEGLALVVEGDIARGMGQLDEATTAVTAGELTEPSCVGITCCYLIRACEQVRDYDRAAQWCERVREFCRRWNYTALFSACRIQYASLLTTRGEWCEAESEIDALARHVERIQPRLLPVARIRLAELRRRQGRWEEAESLFAEGGSHTLALLGRAALALDRGDAAAAAELAEEYLRRVPEQDRTERVPGLELLIGAKAASGEIDVAKHALEELRGIAGIVKTDPLQAGVADAEGAILSAMGDFLGARRRLEESAALHERSRTPFEAARARAQLARTLRALGRREGAALEARAAVAVFEQLGADRDAAVARVFLAELEARTSGRGGKSSDAGRLTHREIEVLRLVAQGLSDKEVALRLGLSEHTIHRHITNVLTKTGLPSRTAAVAHAARKGLI